MKMLSRYVSYQTEKNHVAQTGATKKEKKKKI
jgi:hypothetical protein